MKILTEIRQLNTACEDFAVPKAGDSTDPTVVMTMLKKVWPVLRPALIIAKIFTNDAADKVIDGIIKWGDLLA